MKVQKFGPQKIQPRAFIPVSELLCRVNWHAKPKIDLWLCMQKKKKKNLVALGLFVSNDFFAEDEIQIGMSSGRTGEEFLFPL